MKYRKKPVVIEAIQYDGTGNGFEIILNFVGDELWCNDDGDVMIATLEGDHRVSAGDYVIRGVNGEFYPCKPDIFEKTYDIEEEE